MQKHLAIFTGGMGELILQGSKTIESRFSKTRIVPYNVISAGDLVYIKPSGKDIIGQFRVKKVIFFDGLEKQDIEEIRIKYNENILADSGFWVDKMVSKYATLIFIGQTTPFITSPIKIPKKDLRGWMVLDDSGS